MPVTYIAGTWDSITSAERMHGHRVRNHRTFTDEATVAGLEKQMQKTGFLDMLGRTGQSVAQPIEHWPEVTHQM